MDYSILSYLGAKIVRVLLIVHGAYHSKESTTLNSAVIITQIFLSLAVLKKTSLLVYEPYSHTDIRCTRAAKRGSTLNLLKLCIHAENQS